MRKSFVLVPLGVLLLALVLRADHAPKNQAAERAPLIDNLGNHEHPIKTDKPLAQRYFNQGLRLIYAFNHDEAIRAFRAAAEIDPASPMARWGIAIALGPNYNVPAEKERSQEAFKVLAEAKKLREGAAPREMAYLDALATRYADPPPDDRKPLDAAYAEAMRKLAAQYPDDQDAAVLYAEALMNLRPWDLWTKEGQPQPGTDQIVSTLEAVLKQNPNHPGANHYYIHAVEASQTPERGIAAAERLGGLMPGAGHMVHMPAHIYMRVGRYGDAVEANRKAVEVDRAYIARYKPEGVYPMMYYPHNIHFLWYATTVEGRSKEAIGAASEVVGMLGDDMVKEMPMLEAFVPTRLYALVRFGKWDDVLMAPRPIDEFTFANGMFHYARGLALASKGELDPAEAEQAALAQILKATPEDKMAMRHPAAGLLAIADKHLSAAIDLNRGQAERAIETLQAAVKLEDALQYDEPPAWYFPLRQELGKALLSAKRPVDAEAVYRDELKRNPENGWSLHGLARALAAQGRAAEAADVRARHAKAWARADHKLE